MAHLAGASVHDTTLLAAILTETSLELRFDGHHRRLALRIPKIHNPQLWADGCVIPNIVHSAEIHPIDALPDYWQALWPKIEPQCMGRPDWLLELFPIAGDLVAVLGCRDPSALRVEETSLNSKNAD